jgi:glycosyltransferase involved in cell wall biosynthesis
LKISLITVSFNAEKTIESTIKSVLSQDYHNIEYILIDGCSADGTMSIVSKYIDKIDIVISEKDNGIYDAINKGIKVASGEIIGLLNADDEFSDVNIISNIAAYFKNSTNLDAIIGDIVFQNDSNQIIRKYSSKNWSSNKFSWGFMPPHPSFYCKKEYFHKYGFYNTSFKIAADFELLIRFLKINNISCCYLPLIMVKMKLGGASTRGFSSLWTINREIYRACNLNGIKTNYFKLYSKYFLKVFEFIN